MMPLTRLRWLTALILLLGGMVEFVGGRAWAGQAVPGAALAAVPSVIPKPARMTTAPGAFVLRKHTVIAANLQDAQAAGAAQALVEMLAPSTGYRFSLVNLSPKTKSVWARLAGGVHRSPDIVMTLDSQRQDLGGEGYALEVTPQQIRLTAQSGAGLFYAVQTLRQLLAPRIECREVQVAEWRVPCVSIVDQPRFPWRGMHLDVSRHFFDKAFIKKYLDGMALYKLNTFHWHLTDDDGWRIEIKKYPRLTQVGGFRGPQGNQYGGYYTQDDIREIVAYARERHITIIPEIEMPGHCNAALYAYPELACQGQKVGVGSDDSRMYFLAGGRLAYCAGKERTFDFLRDVLGEVLELFPSRIIHIGGDECPGQVWMSCPDCQRRMKTLGVSDPMQLQEYFVTRIESFLAARGRRMMGWEQVLSWEGFESRQLSTGSLIMSYFDPNSSLKAARRGNDAVAAFAGNCYFDFHQSLLPSEPQAIGGLVTLEAAYAFEPVLPAATPQEAAHILGGQACLWTEYVPTPEHAEYMTYPRLCALAEALWSPRKARDWPDFQRRLAPHLDRLERLKINYRHPQPGEMPSAR